jgi:proteasome lid subunit RPN8/RPN11
MTIDLTPILPELFAHAEREQPRECCGLAIVFKGKLQYRACKNISETEGQFEIDPEDYALAEDAGEIVGVCHSHVYVNPNPSEADLVMCERGGVPWLIVNYPTGDYRQFEPKGYVAPLIGRTYSHAVLDCYQIVVDHFDRELNIKLPHFCRTDSWWEKGQNLYMEGLEKAGFVILGDQNYADIRKHDCFLMQVSSPVPNHAAVYIGDNMILQHVAGRLSSRDIYGGFWRKSTNHVLRHKALM